MNNILSAEQIIQYFDKLLTSSAVSGVKRKTISGTLLNQDLKVGIFPAGVCVSITTAWPVACIAKLCLLLAATPEICDDAVYVEMDKVWLLRRYPENISQSDLELILKQQIAIASILKYPTPKTNRPRFFIGKTI